MDRVTSIFEQYYIPLLARLDELMATLTRDLSGNTDSIGLLMVLFLVPLAFAVLSRRFVASLSIVGAMALLAGTFAARQPLTVAEGRFFLLACSTAFLLAFGCAIDLLHAWSLHRRLRRRTQDLESALKAARHDLDQERLWRRAGGDESAGIADEEMRVLIGRLSARLQAEERVRPTPEKA